MQNNDLQAQLNAHKGDSKNKRIIIILAVVFILAVAYYFFSNSNKVQNMTYNTKEVKRGDLQVSVLATGNLEPTNSVDIGIEVSGTIEEIFVDFNDKVKEGQILAKLDRVKLQTLVDSSKASLTSAKANLSESKVNVKNKKATYDRVQQMFEQSNGKYPSKNDLDDAKFSYESAMASFESSQAKVSQAEFNLKTDEDNLEKAVVKSSINGIVLNRAIEVGQTVAASMNTPVLFTLAKDLTQMELVVSIDEADVADIKEGLSVDFSVDAYPNRIFKGEIKQVRFNPINVNGVVTYETVVSAKNKELLLRPGMTASATIFTKKIENSLIIPNAALRYKPKNIGQQGENQKGSKPLVGMKRGGSKATTKTMDKEASSVKMVWILENNEPKRVAVKVLANDSLNSAVSSKVLNESSKIIVSQSLNNE